MKSRRGGRVRSQQAGLRFRREALPRPSDPPARYTSDRHAPRLYAPHTGRAVRKQLPDALCKALDAFLINSSTPLVLAFTTARPRIAIGLSTPFPPFVVPIPPPARPVARIGLGHGSTRGPRRRAWSAGARDGSARRRREREKRGDRGQRRRGTGRHVPPQAQSTRGGPASPHTRRMRIRG